MLETNGIFIFKNEPNESSSILLKKIVTKNIRPKPYFMVPLKNPDLASTGPNPNPILMLFEIINK